MFAVLKTGGKQYRVQAGDVLRVEKLSANAGDKVQFNEILMVGSTVGWMAAPYVEAPAGLADLAGALLRIDDRTAIVPGLSVLRQGRADVMHLSSDWSSGILRVELRDGRVFDLTFNPQAATGAGR